VQRIRPGSSHPEYWRAEVALGTQATSPHANYATTCRGCCFGHNQPSAPTERACRGGVWGANDIVPLRGDSCGTNASELACDG
jgi:hypothetical protein